MFIAGSINKADAQCWNSGWGPGNGYYGSLTSCSNTTLSTALASTAYIQWDGVAGTNMTFTATGGFTSGSTVWTHFEVVNGSWAVIQNGTGATANFTCQITQPAGNGWDLLVFYYNSNCPPTWNAGSATVQYRCNSQSSPTISFPSGNITVCQGATVNYSVSSSCNYPVTMVSGQASGTVFPVGTTTVTYKTYNANGAGGFFTYPAGSTNQTIALNACQSIYGSGGCTGGGGCGYYTYYYGNGQLSCNCAKPIGQYEFIYDNSGYTQVGQDYGGLTTTTNYPITAGSTSEYGPFTRVKGNSTCASSSWALAQPDLRDYGATTASFTVTVQSSTNNVGTITAPSSICLNGSATISNVTAATTGSPASAGPYYDYYWERTSSPAVGWTSFQTGSGATTASLPSAVTGTPGTYMLARNSYWGCAGEASAPFLTLTVDAAFSALQSGGSSPICYNTTPTTFTANGSGGSGSYTYLWYKNAASTGVTTSTYSPGNLTSTSTIYCNVTSSGGCGSANTTPYTVTVDANLTASQSGGSSPICYNTTPTTFTASGSGGTGSYTYLWYKNGSPSGVTTNTYSPGNLTATSTIYCAVTSGSCGTVNTTPYTVSVDANFTASQSGGSSPICYNSTPTTFTASGSGGTGSYTYLWYLNGGSTGVTTNTYSPGNLTGTSTIYCAVTSGSCGTVNTTPYTVTVYGNLAASQSGGSSPLCYNTAPGTFSVSASGGTGSYAYLWYLNGGSTGVTTTSYAPGNLTGTSTIYCAVTSGSCGTVNTTPATITVYGNLTASQSGGSTNICYNTTPTAFTASGSGGTGSYTYLWYKNAASTGVTTNTYSPGNLTSTSTIYCAVTSGSCGTANTTPYTVAVDANLTAGISGGTTPTCYSSNPGTFTATGNGGTGSYTYQWYNTGGAIGGSTASTYTPGTLTSSNTYSCSVTSGSCGTVTAGPSAITVEPPVSNYGTVSSAAGNQQTVCNNVAPNNGNPFTVTGAAGSSGSFSYQWYYQNGLIAAPSGSNTTGWTACGASQGSGYNTANFTATGGSVDITYACLVTPASPVCLPGQWAANDVQITVLTTGPQESSAGGDNVCLNGSVSLTSNLSAVIPATYQWYSSTSVGFGSPTTIPGATSPNYTPPTNISGTLYYEIIATFSGSGCTPATSPAQTVQVYTVPSASQSGGTSPICYNTSPGTFTAAGSGGSGSFSYQWYNSGGSIGGATSNTYDPGNLIASNAYHCTVTDVAGCGVNGTTPFSVTVDAALTATVSGGSSPICYNTSPGTFTATAGGGTGSYTYQWYDGSGAVSGQTASTYAPGNLTASNAFFCAVSSGSCGTVNSSVVNITVFANLTANIVGGSSPICYNTAPGTMRIIASGGSGTYTYQWYNSSGSVGGATASSYAPGNLTASNSYYCNVVGGTCGSVNSATVNIVVDPILAATIGGGLTPICYNTDPGAFTATGTGGTGSYTYQWYNSSGSVGGATSSTYDPGSIIASNAYHCSVTSGTCGTVSTSTTAITVDANLTAAISGGVSPICYNSAPGIFTATGAGGTGSYTYQWYDGGGSVGGATASTYAPGNLTVSNSYHCSVTSGSCGTVSTSSTSIIVDGDLSATIAGGNSPICYNSAPGTFTARGLGGTGSYTYQWYNNSGAVGGATASSYAPGNITADNAYYCAVTSGSCGTVNTSTTSISVDAALAATISGGTTPICYNTDPGAFTATGSGGTGSYTYQWYNGAGSIGGATSSTYDPGNLVASNSYHCSVTSGTCGTVNTGSTAITVDANLTATISGGTTPICYNASPGTFTATGHGGEGAYTYQWFRTSGSIGGATASTYAPGNLISSDAYHCSVTSGSCGTAATSTTSISVDAATVASASNTGPYVVGQTIGLRSSSAGATSYHWSGPNGYTATGQNVNITGATTAMTGTYTVVATNASGCTATASTDVVVTTTALYTWTGLTDNDWATVTNWSPTAPVGGPNACAVDVIIPNQANYPVISSAVQVGNVQISPDARITLNGANINVCKDWTSSLAAAAVISGSGTLVLNGSSVQNITGRTQVQEMMVDNTAGVNLQSNAIVNVYVSLDLASGNIDVTNGTMTFKSPTVDSVAILDNFSPGYTGTITGNIHAERYYDASTSYDQHYMGSPVHAPALSQFGASGTPGFVISQQCDETQLRPWSPYGTVFSLHESNGVGCGLQQWKVETTATLPNAQDAVGYSVLRAGSGTLVLTGTANLNSSYAVSGLTNSGWQNNTLQHHTEHSGWQLMSNPFLAPINLSSVPAGFDGQVQVWNADGPYANSYQPATIGTDAGIAPFQAFMVHKTSVGGTATFTINASDRVRAMYAFHSEQANQLNIVAANTATGKLDQTTVSFNAAATDSFDAMYDAAKLPGKLNRHTLYTVNSDLWMSRNTLHSITTTSTVPMGFEPGATGNYKLTFNGLNTFDPTSYIILEDKALNVMYDVRNGDYNFTADSADNWNRFVLHFTPPAQVNTTDASCTVAGTIHIQQPGTANWNYTLSDAGNAIVASGTLNQSQQITIGVPAGAYTLTLVDTNNYQAVKTIVVGGAEMIPASFDLPAVAGVNQAVNLTADVQGAATYQWNFGNGTSANGTTVSAIYTQPGVYQVTLSVTSSTGCASVKTQAISVSSATGLASLTNGNLKIWSHDNKVFVDFTALHSADATVIIYDILGQEISNEKVTNTVVYQKQINNIEAAYMIVMVKNDSDIITKKVFIDNMKQ